MLLKKSAPSSKSQRPFRFGFPRILTGVSTPTIGQPGPVFNLPIIVESHSVGAYTNLATMGTQTSIEAATPPAYYDIIAAPPPPPVIERFPCIICFDRCPLDELSLDLPCGPGHRTCRACMLTYIEGKLAERRYPIVCPGCSPTDESATKLTRDLVELVVTTESMLARWDEVELGTVSDLVTCPKCKQSARIDKDDFRSATSLTCISCRHRYCPKCNDPLSYSPTSALAISTALTPHICGDVAADEAMLASGPSQRRCPTCKNRFERTAGCNHMTCPSPGCDTHFCVHASHKGVEGFLIVKSRDAEVVRKAVGKHSH